MVYVWKLFLEKNRNEPELSNSDWALKKDKNVPSMKWKILCIVHSKPTSSYGRLGVPGKSFIINFIGENRVLNKRSEAIRHQNKYLIKM